MPRNRMIKTEFWEETANLSMLQQLLILGLSNLSDDYGVVKGDPRLFKVKLFPINQSVTIQDIEKSLKNLAAQKIISIVTIKGQSMYYIHAFREEQVVVRKSQWRNCTEEELLQALNEDSMSTHVLLNEDNQPKTAPKQPEMAKIDQKQGKNDGDTVLDPLVSDFDHVFIYNTIDNTNVFNNKYPQNVEQPPKPPKKSKSVRTHSVEATAYADYFASTLPSTVKVTESMRSSWAKVYDDMIRLDKRTHDEIYEVTAWARDDGFWRRNFLSANKLRNKNDDGITYYELFLTTIRYKMNKNGNRQQQPGQREQVTAEDAVRQHNDLRRIFGLEGGSEAVGSTAMALGAAAKN